MKNKKGELTKIEMGESKLPKVICPHCKKVIEFDILTFRYRVSEIMATKCPFCGGSLYVGILILVQTDMPALANMIQNAVQVLSPKNNIMGKTRTADSKITSL